MKRKLMKKLVYVSGLLFMTFPAWSAVPSNLLTTHAGWNQSSVTADIASPLFEGGMILAKGGGGNGGGGSGAGSGGNGGGAVHDRSPCILGNPMWAPSYENDALLRSFPFYVRIRNRAARVT